MGIGTDKLSYRRERWELEQISYPTGERDGNWNR